MKDKASVGVLMEMIENKYFLPVRKAEIDYLVLEEWARLFALSFHICGLGNLNRYGYCV